jgi:hypothetical protein
MIAVVTRVFVTDHFAIEAQHRASGPLRSICDRWSGLLASLKGKDGRSRPLPIRRPVGSATRVMMIGPPPNGQSSPSTRV